MLWACRVGVPFEAPQVVNEAAAADDENFTTNEDSLLELSDNPL